jgi:hypothetical protein
LKPATGRALRSGTGGHAPTHNAPLRVALRATDGASCTGRSAPHVRPPQRGMRDRRVGFIPETSRGAETYSQSGGSRIGFRGIFLPAPKGRSGRGTPSQPPGGPSASRRQPAASPGSPRRHGRGRRHHSSVHRTGARHNTTTTPPQQIANLLNQILARL